MKRCLSALGVLLLVIAGCSTTSSTSTQGREIHASMLLAAALAEQNRERIERYASFQGTTGDVFVEQLTEVSEGTGTLSLAPETMAYEGVRFLSLLRLVDVMPIESQYRFLQALFTGIPEDIPIGQPFRDIVVPDYFKDGSPLICHVAVYKTQLGTRVVAVFFNADGLRTLPRSTRGKDMLPSVPYPGVLKGDGGSFKVGDSYAFLIVNENRLTSFGGAEEPPRPVSSATSELDRVNLSEEYLRDANPENDRDVEGLLKPVLKNQQAEPNVILTAKMNDFLRCLYAGDYEGARERVVAFSSDALLAQDGVSPSVRMAIEIEAPVVYRIAMALIRGDESVLTGQM